MAKFGYNFNDEEVFIDYDNKDFIFKNIKKYHNLKILHCDNKQLIELPHHLPNTLEILNCSNNLIKVLPALPESLIELNCSNNPLIKAPILPKNLLYLIFSSIDCSNKSEDKSEDKKENFNIFPKLPDNLRLLDCSYNKLSEFPENLPDNLNDFICSYNKLVNLPVLPQSLQILNCFHNLLVKLPEIPDNLKILTCDYNKLSVLPDFPELFDDENLGCSKNAKLKYIYDDFKIKTINETNLKIKIIKKMKLLDRTLLLEHSAKISLNPKRIERLLESGEIDFFDDSFDNLTS